MLLDGASELLVDIMTANRSLSGITTASSILDTSNYTFHAITYGKDADGFKYHAHTILSPSGNGIIKVLNYQYPSVSSYHGSAFASLYPDIYQLMPESPAPTAKRLEAKSTLPNYKTNVPDLGHYINPIIDPSLSSYAHLIGTFPPATGIKYWVVSSASDPVNSIIYSGTIGANGGYNSRNLMDSSGFLTFAPGNGSDHFNYYDADDYTKGVVRAPVDPERKVSMGWFIPSGDAAAMLLFGGVYHIGLWYLDLKEMLKQGYNPPYSFNTLNNIRKYKLFSKKTFNKDLLYIQDVGGVCAFKTILESGTFLTNSAIYYLYDINFN